MSAAVHWLVGGGGGGDCAFTCNTHTNRAATRANKHRLMMIGAMVAPAKDPTLSCFQNNNSDPPSP